jgi:predicted deacetylase
MITKEKIIYFGIALTTLAILNIGVYGYMKKHDQLPVHSAVDACVPVVPQVTDRTVVLRVDDIQAYTWRETSMRMMSDAESRGIPLTLAIIPVGLLDDTELVAFLKTHACKHEYGLHGWDHGIHLGGGHAEFEDLSKQEAMDKIERGMNVLKGVTDDPVRTWVPPLNVHSSGTVEALNELGFTHISTEGKKKFDYDASTYSYDEHVLIAPDVVGQKCEEAFTTQTYCIIMLHPQDFADGPTHNEELYQKYYISLIDALKAKGYSFARFEDLGQ